MRAREVPPDRAEDAVADVAELDIIRHPHVILLRRAWELRDNVSPYAAMYVVLAEALEARLLTCDRALGAAAGHVAAIEVIR